jgi:hypothetical protein
MPLGQSGLVTVMTHGLIRRVGYMAARTAGQSHDSASEFSGTAAITAASAVGAASAVATADLAGAALSAAYLGLAQDELDRERVARENKE